MPKKKANTKPVPKEKPEGYVFGRPTKYRPEYCQKLIEHMKKGFSFKTFAAEVDVTESTLAQWVLENQDFSNAKELGRVYEKAIWDKIVMQCAATGKGNATAIIWATKNKFPNEYKERNETPQININNSVNQNQITIKAWDDGSENRLKELQERVKQKQLLLEAEVIE
ncbi:MAG: Salicola phage CGphi29 [Bacteroidota bacterium]|jgi:transposase